MTNGITSIDHVLVGVDDLDGAARAWRRLGFTLTPRGRHVGRMSGNYCIMFGDDYVELIGVVDPSQPEPPNIRMLRQMGQGLIATAMASEGAEATHAGFAAAGLAPLAIADLSRLIELPEGEAETRFRLVQLPAEATPEFRLFVCEHLTPELARRPAWLSHPNGVTGLRSATVAVADPLALAAPHGAIFGAGNVVVTDDMLTVFAGRHRLHFVTPDDLPLLLPEFEVPAELRLPKGIAVSFSVADSAATAACLEEAGVGFDEPVAGHLHVPPAEATGVLVEFAAV